MSTITIEQINLTFAVVTFVLSGGALVSLFMMAPDEFQKRVTKNDRAGAGFVAIGLMLGMISGSFALRLFTPTWGIFDLSSYVAQLSAMFGGAIFFMGVVVALPDKITDPLLEQKNVKWLLLAIAVLLTIGVILL